MSEAVIILLIIIIHCFNEILRAAELATSAAHDVLRAIARKVAERLAGAA